MPIELEEAQEVFKSFAKSKLDRKNPMKIGRHSLSHKEIISCLSPLLTDERRHKLEAVVRGRSLGLAVVLENIYDRGNISAVMRSAESLGYINFHLINSDKQKFKAANRVTKGAEKWLDVHIHSSAPDCVRQLKEEGFQIYATHLTSNSVPISEVDFTRPTAVVLGNEKDGVSEEMLSLVDGNFVIPMMGFSQSFNISVAGALIFYHSFLARQAHIAANSDLSQEQADMILANYCLRCFDNPEKLIDEIRQRNT